MLFSVLLFSQSQINWNNSLDVSTSGFGNLHPRIVSDANGNALILWGNSSSNRTVFSRWNGSSFTNPAWLNTAAYPNFAASWAGPDIASKGDTVYVVFKMTPEDTNHIYCCHSFNGGVSFTMPVRVDFIADSVCRFPTVAVDASGNPMIAFMKFNSSFMQSRWVVTKSNDYGNTFTTDVLASGWSGGNVCDCCPGSLLFKDGKTFMTYRDNLNNVRDTWTAYSSDNGISFTNGWNVDQNNWVLSSCPSMGPDAAIIGDTLYTVFATGASGTARCYLSKSLISTQTVVSIQPLTASMSGITNQNYPRIDASGNALAIVWKQVESGNAKLALLFTNNVANGFSSPIEFITTSNVTNVDVALHNGKIMTAWEDDMSGTVKYRDGTYTDATMINPTTSTQKIICNSMGSQLHLFHSSEINQVTVFNVTGTCVLNEMNPSPILSLANLSNGFYIVQFDLKNSNQKISLPFVKTDE